MAKTERESDRRRSDRLVDAAETSKELAEWRRLQQRNLNKLGLLKRNEWPRCHRESSWQVRQSRPCQKEKGTEPSVQSTRSWGGGERVKVGESRTLAREKMIRARAWRGKGGLHSKERGVPRRRGRARKKSCPRTCKWKHERVSGHKSSPGRSAESWFHSKSGQT